MRSLTRKTILLLFLVPFLLASCRVVRVGRSAEVRTADSVRIVETIRDTVVTIQPDSSLIRALIECDSTGRATINRLLEYQGGRKLKPPEVDIDANNVLTATAHVDSLAIYLHLKERYETHTTEALRVSDNTIEVEVNRLTGWQKLWIKLGKTLSGAFAAGILFKLFKPKISTLWKMITKA